MTKKRTRVIKDVDRKRLATKRLSPVDTGDCEDEHYIDDGRCSESHTCELEAGHEGEHECACGTQWGNE